MENKDLIKEFLGKKHELCRTMSASQFEDEWEWIMPVYVKIVETIEYSDHKDAILDAYFPREVFINAEKIYSSCVVFIKSLNAELIKL